MVKRLTDMEQRVRVQAQEISRKNQKIAVLEEKLSLLQLSDGKGLFITLTNPKDNRSWKNYFSFRIKCGKWRHYLAACWQQFIDPMVELPNYATE
eukprot:g39592.t1